MSTKQRKRPNALKHGVYSRTVLILPGEDIEEFRALHSALIDEWKPSGPTLDDAVFRLADYIWHRQRAQRFVRAKIDANTFNPSHPAFDEGMGMGNFMILMCTQPETAFAKAHAFLKADKLQLLKEKFPRSNYKSTAEWAEDIINEVHSVWIPALPQFEKEAKDDKTDPMRVLMRSLVADRLLFNSMLHERELLEHELDQIERLDAAIAKTVKFIMETTAMKQIFQQTSVQTNNKEPIKVTTRRSSLGRSLAVPPGPQASKARSRNGV